MLLCNQLGLSNLPGYSCVNSYLHHRFSRETLGTSLKIYIVDVLANGEYLRDRISRRWNNVA